jgi:hypothetical protein
LNGAAVAGQFFLGRQNSVDALWLSTGRTSRSLSGAEWGRHASGQLFEKAGMPRWASICIGFSQVSALFFALLCQPEFLGELSDLLPGTTPPVALDSRARGPEMTSHMILKGGRDPTIGCCLKYF